MNVVVYQGDKTLRKCIQAHEFYSFEKQPLFDVLVTSYEMVQLDASILRKFNWSSIVSKYLKNFDFSLLTLLCCKSVYLVLL